MPANTTGLPIQGSPEPVPAPEVRSGWERLDPEARRALDRLYWGDGHLHPKWCPDREYCPPMVDAAGGRRGLLTYKDDEASRAHTFASQWAQYRLGFGLSVEARKRGRELPGALKAKVTSSWPDAFAREGRGEPPFPVHDVACWQRPHRSQLPRATSFGTPPGPDWLREFVRSGAPPPVRADAPQDTFSGAALRRLQEEARRRGETDRKGRFVQEFLASPAYRVAVIRALQRVSAPPPAGGVGSGRDEALLVGGPSDGLRLANPGHTDRLHTVTARQRRPARRGELAVPCPLPTNVYRRTGTRLPDGTQIYEYVPPAE